MAEVQILTAKPLDIELLKDLRSLGKPPTFDGTDAEYQNFRFSFPIQITLVGPVSQQLRDRCEAEKEHDLAAGTTSSRKRFLEVQHTDLLTLVRFV